jgi:glycosyltransferase involved in cell wall biosynthesis
MRTLLEPTFSVVIPSRNMSAILRHTLPRVLNQTVRPSEIIVVDSDSNDGTSFMLQEDFPSVRVIRESTPGVGRARNTGMRNAQSEYIAFMDADDFWLPSHIEILQKIARRFPDVGLISTSGGRRRVRLEELVEETGAGQRALTFGRIWGVRGRIRTVDLLVHKRGGRSRYSVHSSTAAVKAEFIHRNQVFFPDLNYNEDLIFWNKIALLSRVAISRSRTVVIAQHNTSATAALAHQFSVHYPIRCDAYTRRPVYEHLVAERDNVSEHTRRSVDVHLDGILTGSWRSTLFLGLQPCARRARLKLRYPWRPQAILFSVAAFIPMRLGRFVARLLQKIHPPTRFGVPISPFLEWVDRPEGSPKNL